jgi:hypothetical protein
MREGQELKHGCLDISLEATLAATGLTSEARPLLKAFHLMVEVCKHRFYFPNFLLE